VADTAPAQETESTAENLSETVPPTLNMYVPFFSWGKGTHAVAERHL
jgi:hypothetical protein